MPDPNGYKFGLKDFKKYLHPDYFTSEKFSNKDFANAFSYYKSKRDSNPSSTTRKRENKKASKENSKSSVIEKRMDPMFM
jgi:hypothetical protein